MHVITPQNDVTRSITIWIFSMSSSTDIVYVVSYTEPLECVQQWYGVFILTELARCK